MKNFLLATLVLFLSATTLTEAQDIIPNHSFETWDGTPDNWVNPLLIAGINNVVPSDDAQAGSLSARLFSTWSDNTNEFVPANLNSMPVPVTEQHSSLNGWFKGTSVNGDVLAINLLLYSDGSISGTGYFSTDETTSDWTSFSVPITYVGSAPTEAYIYIIVGSESGDASEGTEYLIDNLTWDGASSIGDRTAVEALSLSPNPAIDHLDVNFTLPAPDRLSFNLITPTGQVHSIAHENEFPAGENTLEVSTADLAPGIYMIRADGETYTFVRKFVVGR